MFCLDSTQENQKMKNQFSLKEFSKEILPLRLWCWLVTIFIYKVYSRKNFAQAGQDLWIAHEAFCKARNGYFVEIGSTNGVVINNTYLLEKRYGWSGICIEPNPYFFQHLQLNRSSLCLNICVDQQSGEVDFLFDSVMGGILDGNTDLQQKMHSTSIKPQRIKTRTLLEILETHRAPKVIHYLSIDVEGAEERILIDFPFDQYTFLTLTIERPTEALHRKLSENKYHLVKVIPELDCLYIHESFQESYTVNVMSFYDPTSRQLLAERRQNNCAQFALQPF
jgi:FkbM family methyltransferase